MAGTGRDDYNPVASEVPYDNSSSGLTADDTQGAIDEAYASAANASRGPTICGFDGTASSGRYLEFYANNPSNNNPFVVAEPVQLIALSISASSNSTGTVTVYKNGVSVTTLSLSAARTNRVKNLAINYTDLDEISASVTSGSISRPTLFLFLKTLPS